MFNHLAFALKELNKEATVNFFEDGTGTYIGCVHNLNLSKRRFIYRLLRRPFPNLTPSFVYVNNKEYYEKLNPSPTWGVEQINRELYKQKEYCELIRRVFDFHTEGRYKSRRYIFLTQPVPSVADFENKETKLLNAIQAYSDNILVRVHPRQKERKLKGFLTDSERSLWEIVALLELSDNHVLISFYSTAQIVPKLLFDKEPWLVFTYNCFDTNGDKTQMKKSIEELKSLYREPHKIICIDRASQLEDLLSHLGTK